MSTGVLARTAAQMRRQPRSRISATLANPPAQTARKAMGTQSRGPGADGAGGKVSWGNGSAICTIVNETAGGVII
jgi:hypothetical protein